MQRINMQRIAAISFAFLISWQYLLKGAILIWFLSNQSYIAHNLCVNRNKPELSCNGKCILMQRLQAADEERREAQERPLKFIEKIELSHYLLVDNQHIEFKIFAQRTVATSPLFAVIVNRFALRLLKPPEL